MRAGYIAEEMDLIFRMPSGHAIVLGELRKAIFAAAKGFEYSLPRDFRANIDKGCSSIAQFRRQVTRLSHFTDVRPELEAMIDDPSHSANSSIRGTTVFVIYLTLALIIFLVYASSDTIDESSKSANIDNGFCAATSQNPFGTTSIQLTPTLTTVIQQRAAPQL